ncbi:glycosyltransferase family 4 protein [Thermodesulforhabdus norvegica]|uniref:Glycosyltransferase involved in cell wall bisynthesis n=1 Tax=Thermodesulforhabdus norvegica TaxID=39841 RepID=A0A1I4W9N3_9BACT|nr:glycosyltransferase family 4 protein [Thermodesulforhabdus norvegica]SFN10431.1 Glycosyltransferase involved in cell wall bisynthesis [Thermodesulforhabdus norvegica]
MLRIGFISTRFAGVDGVSLESSKWAEVLERAGHRCYWFAGLVDRDPDFSYVVPEAFFCHPDIQWINTEVFGKRNRSRRVTEKIHQLRDKLKEHLHEFLRKFSIDLIIVENALTIPMNVPLGLAITELIAETGIPTIAHHHDFYWERTRFSVNAVGDYLRMAFPPHLPSIRHVVINTTAQEELAHRTGISSTVIPNVIEFEKPPEIDPEKTLKFRRSLGIADDEFMILQPTRIVQRKGIEWAIELVRELRDPRCKLVISHEAGDEGYEYAEWLKQFAEDNGVPLIMVNMKIADPLIIKNNHSSCALSDGEIFTLWDIYPHADFITYPSLYEGFGNAFLEAVYFKKPLLINRYAVFARDIEPMGFRLVVMDGFLTKKNVEEVRKILYNPDYCREMVEHNYEVASRHFSYTVLKKRLQSILVYFFGAESV